MCRHCLDIIECAKEKRVGNWIKAIVCRSSHPPCFIISPAPNDRDPSLVGGYSKGLLIELESAPRKVLVMSHSDSAHGSLQV